jgi:subtilisin family serine protease
MTVSRFLPLAVVFVLLAGDVRATDIVVEFRDAPATASSLDLHLQLRRDLASLRASAKGLQSGPRVAHDYRLTLHGAAVRGADSSTILALQRLSYVKQVTPDTIVTAYSNATSGRAARHSLSPQSSVLSPGSVVVAIIDSGVDYNHAAFAPGFGAGAKVIGGWDFVNDDADPMDDAGHGTHVAGIVAGNGGGVTGVAPEARLLAYKVLTAKGQGTSSDILAAIERSVDPNGDGNPSDHADVINLSLGGPGGADDPMARAVDAAVSAGVIVCTAAGNTGEVYDIGTPAAARTAITVGASNAAGELAEFSTRGPAIGSLDVKPEIAAPGVAIVSALPGGGTIARSGTSMATPYIAGIAALLRAAHPEWTPQRIKEAIVSSGTPISNEEPVAQGAGNVSLARALASDVSVTPAAVNLAVVSPSKLPWSGTRTLRLKNESAVAKTLTVTASSNNPSASATPALSTITLQAGESRDVDIAFHVNASIDPPGASFSYGGWLRVDGGDTHLTVPWAFVLSARGTAVFEGGTLTSATWVTSTPISGVARFSGPSSVEALLSPGTYDLVMVAESEGTPVLIVSEQQVIADDLRTVRSIANAPHVLTLAARDVAGNPLSASSANVEYDASLRLVLPATALTGSLELAHTDGRELRVSTISDRMSLLATESAIDPVARTIYVAQHAPLRGISGARELTTVPSDYASKAVSLHYPASSQNVVRMFSRWMLARAGEVAAIPPLIESPAAGSEWNGTVFMTNEPEGDYTSAAGFSVIRKLDASGGPLVMATPAIHRDAEGFFATNLPTRPPLPLSLGASESFVFGDGSAVIPFTRYGIATDFFFSSTDMTGFAGDLRRASRDALTFKLRNSATGATLASGSALDGSVSVALPAPTAYTLAQGTSYRIADRTGTATMEMQFDSSRDDSNPPNLTSVAILDAAGRHVSRLAAMQNARLVFSAGDYSFPDGTTGVFRDLDRSKTRVSWRRSGESAWQPLSVQVIAEDRGSEERAGTPVGVVHQSDLSAALAVAAPVDLQFEISDSQGNSLRYVASPGFIVDPPAATRRRAAGH